METKTKMHTYIFDWHADGTTVMKAATLAEATEAYYGKKGACNKLYSVVLDAEGSELRRLGLAAVRDYDDIQGRDLLEEVKRIKGLLDTYENEKIDWADMRGPEKPDSINKSLKRSQATPPKAKGAA